MKYTLSKKIAATLVSLTVLFSFVPLNMGDMAYAFTQKPGVVNASNLNIRKGPGKNTAVIAALSRGAAVTVLDEARDDTGTYWYKIAFAQNGVQMEGYVSKTYIRTAAASAYQSDSSFEKSIAAFPESYKEKLRQLHAEYPQWVFQAKDTELDWNEAVQNESVVGRNLVTKNAKSSWKSTAKGAYNWENGTWPGFDSNAWVAASPEIICYYMDPRNFLDNKYIFQFLHQGYDATAHTPQGVEQMIRGTFLESKVTLPRPLPPRGLMAKTEQKGRWISSNPPQSQKEEAQTQAPGAGTKPSQTEEEGKHSPPLSSNPPSAASQEASTLGPGTTQPSSKAALPENTEGSPQSTGSPSQKESKPSETAPGETKSPENRPDPASTREAGPGGGAEEKAKTSATRGSSAAPSQEQLGPASMLNNPTTAPATTAPATTAPADDSNSGPGVTGRNAGRNVDIGALSGAGYGDIILSAARQSGVNPYVLIAMILQEQGLKGNSGAISGNTSPYSGIYNYFNIEAYQSGSMTPIQRGLQWASQSGSYLRPWNSREKAIMGGAIFYGENYVKAGQDTFYLKKFNVVGSNLYKHQYMTNIEGAAAEGARLSTAYSESQKNFPFVFSIPVYRNMPEAPSPKPEGDGSPNNRLASLSVSTGTLQPAFQRDVTSYELTVSGTTEVTIQGKAMDGKAQVQGGGRIFLTENPTQTQIRVRAANGNELVYTITIRR